MRITPVTLTVTASPAAPTVTSMAGVRKTPQTAGDSSEQASVCSRKAHTLITNTYLREYIFSKVNDQDKI